MNMVMNLEVPQKAGNFLTILVTISFSRETLFHVVSGWIFTTFTDIANSEHLL
jgi:hypothetical protein